MNLSLKVICDGIDESLRKESETISELIYKSLPIEKGESKIGDILVQVIAEEFTQCLKGRSSKKNVQ